MKNGFIVQLSVCMKLFMIDCVKLGEVHRRDQSHTSVPTETAVPSTKYGFWGKKPLPCTGLLMESGHQSLSLWTLGVTPREGRGFPQNRGGTGCGQLTG